MAQSQAATARFKVPDMSCNHCRMAIMKALGGVRGVAHTEVDLAGKTVTVEYDPAATTPQALMNAIRDAGYSPETA